MRTSLIVTATVAASVLLAAMFGNRIARLAGVSPMEGGDSWFTLCCTMPLSAIVGGLVGIIIAVLIDKR